MSLLRTKRNILAIFCCLLYLLSMLLCSCVVTSSPTEESNSFEQTEVYEQSIFVGTWKCLKENSCNNMAITLTITQDKGVLNIVRDMQSSSPSGSKITFSVDVPNGNSFRSSNTNGTYSLENGILQETFYDGKVNYYSTTGELSTNICQFPFCSKECDDLKYCESHNTEIKRYNSLTNSNKLSICYFIEGRYDYYDEISGGYAGDKYSDKIMDEAATKYGLTAEHAYIIWMNYYSY